LFGNIVDLFDTTTVEQHRQRSENLLDLDAAPGTIQRDHTAVLEGAVCRRLRRRLERDVLLPEQRCLLDARTGIRWKIHIAVHLDGHFRVPILLVELDIGDIANSGVVDLYARSRYEVQYVTEFDGHRVRIIAEISSAGKRKIVDPLEFTAAAGDRQQTGRDQQRTQPGLQPSTRKPH